MEEQEYNSQKNSSDYSSESEQAKDNSTVSSSNLSKNDELFNSETELSKEVVGEFQPIEFNSVAASTKLQLSILNTTIFAEELIKTQKLLLKSIELPRVNLPDFSWVDKVSKQITKSLDVSSSISKLALQTVAQQEKLFKAFETPNNDLLRILNTSLGTLPGTSDLPTVSLPDTSWVDSLLKTAAFHVDSGTIIKDISLPDLLGIAAASFVSDTYSEFTETQSIYEESQAEKLAEKSIAKIPTSVPDHIRQEIVRLIIAFIIALLPMMQNHFAQLSSTHMQEEQLRAVQRSNELQERLIDELPQITEAALDSARNDQKSIEKISILLAKRPAKVRAEPNRDGAIIGSLNTGQIITAIEHSGNWVFVKYLIGINKEGYGWVARRNLVLPHNYSEKVESKKTGHRHYRQELPSPDFWQPQSIESIVASQQTQPISSLSTLKADFWPEDESADDFIEFVEQQRQTDRLVS